MRILLRLLRYVLYLALAGALAGALALGTAYWLIAPRLPSVETLKDVRLQVPLRIYSADDKLVAAFGETKRTPVRIQDVPLGLKQAFLAAEDADFYSHRGIDVGGIFRAVWLVITTGSKHVAGGSTITQQVARNFFLSPEVSYTRKLSEIFLAFRIENALTKDEILELYLNKIFLGHRSYGVSAAAEFYYGKTLDQLTVAECAMLASLPKFPSTGNPISNPPRAIERRNYVLGRMLDNGFIDQAAYDAAMKSPDLAYAHEPPVEVDAPYFAEMVRLEAMERLGNNALTDGYVVKTTLDSVAQDAANKALRGDLMTYDQRHGYRGPEAHADLASNDKAELDKALLDYRPLAGLIPGIVTKTDAANATVYLFDGSTITLGMPSVEWARPHIDEDRRGATPKHVDDVLKRGDIVRLLHNEKLDVSDRDEAPAKDEKPAKPEKERPEWMLAQLPAAEAAFVAISPEDGAIKTLVGGFSFLRSKFNRVTQSNRSPGSGFKPFIYSAAFEHGFTPASVVNDAPLVFPDPSKPNGLWTPKNDDDTFQGPIRLREALVKSVNLVSVRVLDAIGVHYAREYITRFGFTPDQIPETLSMALGTASVSPLTMARGYAVFANGGYLIDPYFVTEIDDRDGKVVYTATPALACANCAERAAADAAAAPARSDASASTLNPIGTAKAAATPPAANGQAPRLAPRVIDVRNAYLVSSLMRDVVRRGTGSAAMVLKRNDLAGKTGSTNDHRDAWFTGFNSKLVASCWVGFDDFGSLGRGEFGAKAALPIWIDFMRVALKDVPEQPFDMPPGISKVRIDPASGTLASAADSGAILEVLKSEDVARLASQPPAEQQQGEQREAYDVF
jgi:penicillin-binding protein 1A